MSISVPNRTALLNSAQTHPPTRRFLLLLPTDDQIGQRERRRIAHRLLEDRDLISRRFDEEVAKLRSLTKRRFLDLRLLLDSVPTRKRTLPEVLAHYIAPGLVRGVVLFTVVRSSITTSRAEGISHLVSVTESEQGTGWYSGSQPADAAVRTTLDRIGALVRDIALDIVMTHSYRGQLEAGDHGQALSHAKADFAVHRGLTSYYGDIRGPALGYFSLASAVRTGEILSDSECQKYDDLWRDFLNWMKRRGATVPPQGGVPATATAAPGIGLSISKHKRAGQLSLNKIGKHVATLPAGRYYLLVAMRKPKNRTLKHRVLALLGRSSRRWKTNAWRIVPEQPLEPFIGLESYLSILPLTLEKG